MLHKPGNRLTALVILAAFTLASCASNTIGTRPENASPDQQQLYSYSDRYAWQGALAGAAIGCLGGMLVSDNELVGCGVGMLAGAALGAGAGTYIAKRQESAAPTQAALNEELGTLEQELAQVRSAREAAARVVARHEARIAEMEGALEAGEMELADARDEIEVMKFDYSQILKTQKALDESLTQIKADLEEERGDEDYRTQLSSHAEAMEKEKVEVDAQVAQMQAILEAEARFMG